MQATFTKRNKISKIIFSLPYLYLSARPPLPPSSFRPSHKKSERKKIARTRKQEASKQNLSIPLYFSRPNSPSHNQKLKPPLKKDQGKEKGRFKQGIKEEEGRRRPSKQLNLQPHLQKSSLSCACCHFKVGVSKSKP